MRSIFLVLSACGAVSHASECQAADESSLLALRSVVRTQRRNTDKIWLKRLRDVADSLTEGSGTTKTADEVQETLAAASEAIAELSPAIRNSIEVAQQQINDASSAVRACHGQAAATRREQLQAQVDQRHAAVESCEADLEAAIAAEEEACARAEDCLCDEARAHHTDQAALCASVTEIYEVAFCEHRSMCTVLQECHADEMQVYNSLRADVEAQLAVLRQEYIAAEQAGCLTALIMDAMTPPITPIPHAALVACDDVDVSALAVNMPELPSQPAACPHGDVICVGDPTIGATTLGSDLSGVSVGGEPVGLIHSSWGEFTNVEVWNLDTRAWVDRPYVYRHIPEEIQGATFFKGPCRAITDGHLTFRTNQAATLYVWSEHNRHDGGLPSLGWETCANVDGGLPGGFEWRPFEGGDSHWRFDCWKREVDAMSTVDIPLTSEWIGGAAAQLVPDES